MSRDDAKQTLAQKMIAKVNQPIYWGCEDLCAFARNDVFEIWNWAKGDDQIDILGNFARIYANQLTGKRYDPSREGEIVELAERAKSEGNISAYVGFLEALLRLTTDRDRNIALREEICEIYTNIGNQRRQVWFMISLALSYIYRKDLIKAKKILIEGYQVCKEIGFDLGKVHILFAMGSFLEAQGMYVVACRLYYRARISFRELGSIFSITARDSLRRIEVEHSIQRDQYENEDDPDKFVQLFFYETSN